MYAALCVSIAATLNPAGRAVPARSSTVSVALTVTAASNVSAMSVLAKLAGAIPPSVPESPPVAGFISTHTVLARS